MGKTSKALLFIGLCVLGGSVTFAGFSAAENYKLKNDNTKLNNQYEIIKKGYDDQQKLIISKDTTIEDLKRQLEELKSQQPTTLTAGLYETGTDTLIKSWEQLIADGDIIYSENHIRCPNKENLTGDLICGKLEPLTSLSFSFDSCQYLTSIDLQNLDTSNVGNLRSLFAYCSSLTKLNLGNFNTDKVETFSDMFSECPALTDITYAGTIEEWKAKNITNATTGIKEDGTVIVHCSDGDYVIDSLTEQPTTLTAGLYETGTNTLIKSWEQLITDGDITITDGALKCVNTELAGDLVCGKVEGLTRLGHTFGSCQFLTSIDLQNLDTSNVTSLSAMFYNCTSLTNVNFDGLDLSKVTSFGDMFCGCLKYTKIILSGLDLSSVNDISYMFAGHSSLISLDLGSFGINSDCKLDFMFNGCNSLTDITYAGTIEEWKAKNITNATTGIKEDGTVTVHCSDGDYVIGASD